MALTFFWRCEGTTLDGTHDFTAGDNTATANGATPAQISASAARIGSNGIATATSGDTFSFDGASIFDHGVGSVGFSFQRVVGTSATTLLRIVGTTANNHVTVEWGSNNLTARHRNSGSGENRTAVTTGGLAASSTGVWHACVARWDATADLVKIELYNSSGTLQEEVTTNLSMTSASDTYTIHIGSFDSTTDWYVDNVFISQVYAEPIQDNFTITSYTEYGVTSTGVPSNLLLLGVG